MAKLASEQIGPLVRKMDDAGKIEQSVLDLLFENGVTICFVNFCCAVRQWRNLTKVLQRLYKFDRVLLEKPCGQIIKLNGRRSPIALVFPLVFYC